ncbi:helix-turn-helix transcriptional regulator [Eggerthellaceae bacterium zg-1084]|nr:helix-turn-helix transcriptional regulator [Berryella wangjianweii]
MGKQGTSSGDSHLVVNRHLHTGSLAAFRATFVSGMMVAFFGIGFYRLWYQFNFYNLHFSADVGMVTVGANLVRVAVIALMVLAVRRRGVSSRLRGVLIWSGFVLMTLSSFMYLLEVFYGQVEFEVLRILIGGVGLVGGEVIWVFFLERLKPGEVLLYAGGGLALSCALSLGLGYLDELPAGMINLFIPALSVFSYWQASSELDRRAGMVDASGERRRYLPESDGLYHDDPQLMRGLWQAFGAFFLYALILGMALGYPDGSLRALSQGARTVHQLLVVALAAGLVWFVLVRGRAFKLSGHWLFLNALLMAAICLLISGDAFLGDMATFLLTNAISCFYIPLVYFGCMIARHVRWSAAQVYAIVYGGSLLFMALGRVLVFAVGPHLDHQPWLLIAMAAVGIVESTLLIRPQFMKGLAPGFELGSGRGAARARAAVASAPAASASALAASAHAASTPDVLVVDGDEVPVVAVDQTVIRLAAFAQRFELTDTERSIVGLMAQGRSRSFIARELSYSEHTIRNYTRTAYRKVGVHSKQELLDRLDEQPLG